MTTAPTQTSAASFSNTAAPWSQRNLNPGLAIIEELRLAKAQKRAAEVAEKQALSRFKSARAEGLLDEHFDDLAEEYCGKGVTITVGTHSRYAEKSYSDTLQQQMKAERDDGTAKPTVSEVIRVKLEDVS